MVIIWCFSEYKNQRLLHFMFSIQSRRKQTDTFPYATYLNARTIYHTLLKKFSMFPSTPSIHMGAKCNCTNSYRTTAQAYERKMSQLTQEAAKMRITRDCKDIAVHLLSLPWCCLLVWKWSLVWPKKAVALADEAFGCAQSSWAQVFLQHIFHTTTLGALLCGHGHSMTS